MPYKDPEKKREWANRYARENRAFFKSLHRCIDCRGQDAYTLAGRARCSACAERVREYNRERGKKNNAVFNEKSRSKYAERKAAGKCVGCGCDMGWDKHSRCASCRAKDAARHRTGINMKGVNGWCSMCGKEKAEHGKLCPACFDKANANLEKGRAVQNRDDHPWRRDELIRIMSITGRAV